MGFPAAKTTAIASLLTKLYFTIFYIDFSLSLVYFETLYEHHLEIASTAKFAYRFKVTKSLTFIFHSQLNF
jgi:hypothetical protein